MADKTEAEIVASVAMQAVAPQLVTAGAIYAVTVDDDQTVQTLDFAGPDYTSAPTRKRGAVKVHDAASLVAYLAKHGNASSEVWADRRRLSLVAVLNAHTDEAAAWEDHRASFEVLATPAWKAWAELDGKFIDQATFAEHIENRAVDIVKPSGADMLEVAQSISATVGVRFESSKLLSNGERQLEYRETVEAKAGRAGRLDIPQQIELALAPFEGAPPYKVLARFRYRITDGVLRLAVALERPEDVISNAFDEVVDSITNNIHGSLFRGVPAAL